MLEPAENEIVCIVKLHMLYGGIQVNTAHGSSVANFPMERRARAMACAIEAMWDRAAALAVSRQIRDYWEEEEKPCLVCGDCHVSEQGHCERCTAEIRGETMCDTTSSE